MNNRSYFALGIMTGTSLDGIDLSLCFTDGKTRLKNIKSSYSYECKECTIKRVKNRKKPKMKGWEYPDW